MAFDNHYPRRKDWRQGYRRAGRSDPTCRPGGGCPYCLRNRRHRTAKREPLTETLVCTCCFETVHDGDTPFRWTLCDRCLDRYGEEAFFTHIWEEGW